jgi:6-phosphogluconolactonase (cycloisomerase 2 family)
MQNRITAALQALAICVTIALAIGTRVVPALAQTGRGSQRATVYAAIGEELVTFNVDLEHAALTRGDSTLLPGFVQEAWASPAGPYLYVTWSNGGASYAGSGIAPRGDKHGITAFRIDNTGALHTHGADASIRSRAVHITGDARARHLLVAYNDPSGISVHGINSDGTIGSEVAQSAPIDAGIYGHQVRVFPTNDAVIFVTRGNEPTATTREDPGAVKVFRYDDGKLSSETSIAESNGVGFRSRHVDFHPTAPFVYLTLEAQNRLLVYRRTDRGLSEHPLFNKPTLADGTGVRNGQTASTIHVHPNGRFVYVGNRGGGSGTTNNIAVFSIDQKTGEPSLVQNIDTRGSTPRTFSVDPSGRLLIVGNQTTTAATPANLAVFVIGSDGKLEFANRYPMAVGKKPLWWMGIVSH